MSAPAMAESLALVTSQLSLAEGVISPQEYMQLFEDFMEGLDERVLISGMASLGVAAYLVLVENLQVDGMTLMESYEEQELASLRARDSGMGFRGTAAEETVHTRAFSAAMGIFKIRVHTMEKRVPVEDYVKAITSYREDVSQGHLMGYLTSIVTNLVTSAAMTIRKSPREYLQLMALAMAEG